MSKNKKQNRGNEYTIARTRQYTVLNRPRLTFLDPHMYVTLKYAETIPFSNATTVGSQNIFNLNSLFDPNRTGVGHQPYGFDQLAALYNRYRVLKTRWIITFGPTTNNPVFCVIVPVNGLLNSAISTATTYESAVEVPFAWGGMIPNAGTATTLRHTGRISLNKLNGTTREEYLADDRFEASVTTSPSEVLTLYIGVYNPSTATVTNNVLVELFYEVDFHDPISIVPS